MFDNSLRKQLLKSLYLGIFKGEDVGDLIEELELLGISTYEIQHSISMIFSSEERLSEDQVTVSDDSIVTIIDNLTDDALLYFLQFWDSGMLDEQDVKKFFQVVESSGEDRYDLRSVEMLVNAILMTKR
ncbi:MAG: hypothetical protein ACP5FK_00375 [bacterium]